jgi:predicted small secreted protein
MGKKAVAVLLGFLSAVIYSGCNTIEGIGKDVKKGGEVIEKAAEKAKS